MCGRGFLTNHYRRHRRTCKGAKKTRCGDCGKDFASPSKLRRHLASCKKRIDKAGEHRRLTEQLDDANNRLDVLRSKLDAKDTEMSRDKRFLQETVARFTRALAEKEDELRALRTPLASGARPPATTGINLSVHMTPWCLDPTAPEYAASLRDDVSRAQDEMGEVTEGEAEPLLSEEFRASVNAAKRRAAYFALARRALTSERPRYIVPDLARRKGMVVMPDGSCRFDDGMSLLMNHQSRVFSESGVGDSMRREARQDLRRALASEAHTAAKRISQSKKREWPRKEKLLTTGFDPATSGS